MAHGTCTKCHCIAFVPDRMSIAPMTLGNADFPGWLRGESRTCFCGHKLRAHRINLFGAIALSLSSGQYGWSYGLPFQEPAEQEALRRCAGPDAEVKVWGCDRCLALARADDGAFGWAWATQSTAQAESLAMENCPGPNPTVVVSFSTWLGTEY